jgi:hypothetical protein
MRLEIRFKCLMRGSNAREAFNVGRLNGNSPQPFKLLNKSISFDTSIAAPESWTLVILTRQVKEPVIQANAARVGPRDGFPTACGQVATIPSYLPPL